MTAAERRLLAQTVLLLGAVRVALWVLPFERIARRAAPPAPRRRRSSAGAPARVAAAVRTGHRLVPGASCLTQALAAETLLRREGYACTLRVGVARGAGGAFKAHAWLECEGKVVVGGDVMGGFAPLPTAALRPG